MWLYFASSSFRYSHFYLHLQPPPFLYIWLFLCSCFASPTFKYSHICRYIYIVLEWISHDHKTYSHPSYEMNIKLKIFSICFLLSISNWDFAWYPWKLYQSTMYVTKLYSNNSINFILFSFYNVSVKIARLAAIRDIIKRSRYAWLLSLSKRSLFCSMSISK